MKQKDIIIIVAVAFVACIASFVISKSLIVKSTARNQEVEIVDAISTTFTPPSQAYFNNDSVNPTQNIQIGGNSNPVPFNGENN